MLSGFPGGAPDKLQVKEQQKNYSSTALCSGRAGCSWWLEQEGTQGRAVTGPWPPQVLSSR